MNHCPDCGTKLTPGGRFCPRCGKPIFEPTRAPGTVPTGTVPAAAADINSPRSIPQSGSQPAAQSASPPGSQPAAAATILIEKRSEIDETVFAPGALLAGRYRIIARLGKGGMGEVYRADDLKLGQPVALKFLPASVGNDARRLERFREEVRISRQVAHPNVCKVYDLDDVEIAPGTTLHFLSMEYIDGEDLSSLLRRIGRLPKDKAVQVARQICAGLAAAHNAGVLHRDLKPANIMLDGRGHAKIMDFGIAGAIGGIAGSDVRSGTPAYMAPESLAGREVSPRSDIYSLGLVLYELFTGKQAFDADTITTATSSRTSTALTRPSTLIDDMDAAAERVIMRCLDEEPANRPGSPLSVAAALPGGDPLRAALEAGETPSPELVAAAGPTGTIRPLWAGAMAAFCVACVVFFVLFAPSTQLVEHLPLDRPPTVLEDRAKEVLRTLGYTDPAKDDAGFVQYRREFIGHLMTERKDDPTRWDALRAGRPAVLRYTYRSSTAGDLSPQNPMGAVRPADPPPTDPGMRQVDVDTTGRLVYLQITPPAMRKRPDRPPASPDSARSASFDPAREPIREEALAAANAAAEKLFELAGLDITAFRKARPMRRPPHAADVTLAWIGVHPDSRDLKWRIEAAFVDGKATWFRQFAKWDLPAPADGSTAPDVDDELGLDLDTNPASEPSGSRETAERPRRSITPGELVLQPPAAKAITPTGPASPSEPPAPAGSAEQPPSPLPVEPAAPSSPSNPPAPSTADASQPGTSSPSPPPSRPNAPPPPGPPKRSGVQTALQACILIIVIAGILFAAHYARRNYRMGRGDVLGASRLAGALLIMRLIIWACTTHHSTSINAEWTRFIFGVAVSIIPAAIAWMLYMAIEPIVRRRDPQLLVSWTRLLSGKWRDPLVGRHILLSCSVACAIVVCMTLYSLVGPMRGGPVSMLMFPSELTFAGVPGTIAYLLNSLVQATINGLLVLFFYIGVGALVRVRAVAIGLLFLFVTALLTSDGGNDPVTSWDLLLLLTAISAGITFFLIRFGLLAIIGMHFMFLSLRGVPMTTDLGAWYAVGTLGSLAFLAALLALGYVSATAKWRSTQLDRNAPRF